MVIMVIMVIIAVTGTSTHAQLNPIGCYGKPMEAMS